jgi:membrane protein CcdC involved in cytochrome C biogenesis
MAGTRPRGDIAPVMPSLPFALHPAAAVGPLAGAVAVFAWRMREAARPLTTMRIVMPPLGMATGFSMFVMPAFRVPLTWAIAALGAGALLFAWPVLRTTTLVRRGPDVMLQRSRAFILVLVALVGVRLLMRGWVEQAVSATQTAALFYLLAFGMIVRWRLAMWREFARLRG